MAVATTAMARGLLMLSPRLMLLLRLSLAMATTAVVMEAMVATDTAVATTARGLLMLSPRLMLLLRPSPAMVATAGATATARGLLSPAMDTAATAMVATDTAGATATAGDTATGVI